MLSELGTLFILSLHRQPALEERIEHLCQILVVLFDVFEVFLNFVQASHRVLCPQPAVPVLTFERLVHLVEFHPALVVRLLALAQKMVGMLAG